MFYNTLGEVVGNYFIENLACGLMGHGMKRIIFGLGTTNTGKGVLTTALRLSCGNYVGSFTGENLAERTNSSNDEAQKLRWAMLLKHKWIIISNEIRTNTNLNGVLINKIASGGDEITGRTHGGEETPFIPHFLTVLLANNIPKIESYDKAVDGRVRVVSYTKNYVDEPSN